MVQESISLSKRKQVESTTTTSSIPSMCISTTPVEGDDLQRESNKNQTHKFAKVSHSDDPEEVGGDEQDGMKDDCVDKMEDDEAEPNEPGMVYLNLEELNPHLVCQICQGYFRDAHTIMECLHTFCKSCLLKKFYEGMRACPRCNVELGPNPLHVMIYDRTMQEVVNKILPELEADDKKKEEEFYRARDIKRKVARSEPSVPVVETRARASSSNPSSSSSSSSSLSAASPLSEHKTARSRASVGKNDVDPAETPILFELIPAEISSSHGTTSSMVLQGMLKPVLKTSGKLKVAQLRKHISTFIGLNPNEIEILCNGDLIGPELSIYFVKCTRWVSAGSHLVLHYRRQA